MKTSVQLLAVAASALVLGACSSIGNKSADEMVRYAVQHNLTRDNQYNFEGKMFVQEVDLPTAQAASAASVDDTVAATATAAEAEVGAATEAAVAATDAAAAEDANAMAAAAAPAMPADKATGYAQWMGHWLRSVSMPYTGAVDIPAGKFELVPELRYDTRNALVSVKLPMQVNINDLSLLVDPAAVAPFVDMYAATDNRSMKPLGDKLVRISMPGKWRQHIPMQSILAAVPKAMDDGYAALDKQAYQKLDMDEEGRKVGARYRVGLITTLKQNNHMASVMAESLRSQLAEAAKSNPQAGISAEDYANTIEALGWLVKLYANPEALTGDAEMEKLLGDMKTHTDFYLDGRGRIVAMRQNMAFPPLMSALVGDGKNHNAIMWWRLHYTAKPTFGLQPTAQNTQDLSQLFPDLAKWLGDEPTAAPSAGVQSLQDLQHELDGVTVTVE